jgi:membrane-associated PAP2 superfamily phosphatase
MSAMFWIGCLVGLSSHVNDADFLANDLYTFMVFRASMVESVLQSAQHMQVMPSGHTS